MNPQIKSLIREDISTNQIPRTQHVYFVAKNIFLADVQMWCLGMKELKFCLIKERIAVKFVGLNIQVALAQHNFFAKTLHASQPMDLMHVCCVRKI